MKKRLRKNSLQNEEKLSGKQFALVILGLSVIVFLMQTNNCTAYNPAFYPSYDVLNPSDIVKENPIAYIDVKDGEIVNVEWVNESTKDGEYILVNEDFFQWAYDLKQAIKDLR